MVPGSVSFPKRVLAVTQSNADETQVLIACLQQSILVIVFPIFLLIIYFIHQQLALVEPTPRLITREAVWKQADAATSALQEFQKSQFFFLLALHIVSLLAISNPSWLEAPTERQIYNNLGFMNLFSAIGVYCLVAGLIALRLMKGYLEWFTLLTALTGVTISFTTWSKSMGINVNANYLKQDGFKPIECGAINPTRYCLQPSSLPAQKSKISQDLIYARWPSIPLVVMVACLLLEKIGPSLLKERMPKVHNMSKWWKGALCILEAYAIICNGLVMITIALTWLTMRHQEKNWTIGQVLAVGIWVPVLVEWVYLAVRKCPKACFQPSRSAVVLTLIKVA